MVAIRLGVRHFSGLGKVATTDKDSLANILRLMAINTCAASVVASAGITDFTDSSTGTANPAGTVDLVIPTVPFDASVASTGATLTTFNTAITAFESAMAVMTEWINRARARAGLPPSSFVDGTVATPGTIPAQTLTVAGVSGASAVDFASGTNRMTLMKENLDIVTAMFNELFRAVGTTPVVDAITGLEQRSPGGFGASGIMGGWKLVAVAAATASSTGASSIAATVMNTFLTACAANIATLAAQYNLIINGAATISGLTDSTGGTATAYPAIAVLTNPIPAAVADAATTSAPKAGFDAQLVIIGNAVASLTARMNQLRSMKGLPLYTDNSGGTVSTTLAAESVALTATTASPNCLDVVTASAKMTVMNNAISSLAKGINDLLAIDGFMPVIDLTPVGAASTVIANIAGATGTGVGGGAALITMLNTAVNSWLTINRNSIASLNAALLFLVGSTVPLTAPVGVAAV